MFNSVQKKFVSVCLAVWRCYYTHEDKFMDIASRSVNLKSISLKYL